MAFELRDCGIPEIDAGVVSAGEEVAAATERAANVPCSESSAVSQCGVVCSELQ